MTHCLSRAPHYTPGAHLRSQILQSGLRLSGPADPGLEHSINNICDKLAPSDEAFMKHLQEKVKGKIVIFLFCPIW